MKPTVRHEDRRIPAARSEAAVLGEVHRASQGEDAVYSAGEDHLDEDVGDQDGVLRHDDLAFGIWWCIQRIASQVVIGQYVVP